MSIYSGFATRFQQQSYDHCIDSLLYILQKRIIKFYQNEQADEQKFITLVLRLHQQMRNMQKSKYLDPKSSQSVNELIKFMQFYQNNLSIKNNDNHSQAFSQQVPIIEHVPSLPEANVEKKKNVYWVQKIIPEQNKPVVVEQNGTNQTAEQDKKDRPQTRTEFKRTSFNSGVIKRVKMRATSRSNLNKDPKADIKDLADTQHPNSFNARIVNNHPQNSNFQQSKTPFSSNGIPFQTQINHIRKKRVRSSSRNAIVNQTEMQFNQIRNDVSDIIRQYITKAKRTFARGHRFRESKDYSTKLHDF